MRSNIHKVSSTIPRQPNILEYRPSQFLRTGYHKHLSMFQIGCHKLACSILSGKDMIRSGSQGTRLLLKSNGSQLIHSQEGIQSHRQRMRTNQPPCSQSLRNRDKDSPRKLGRNHRISHRHQVVRLEGVGHRFQIRGSSQIPCLLQTQ